MRRSKIFSLLAIAVITFISVSFRPVLAALTPIRGSFGNMTEPVEYAGNLYFGASSSFTSLTGTELFKSDGTFAGTVLLKDINLGSNSSEPIGFTIANNLLFFTAIDSGTTWNGNRELWVTDGTSANTVKVKEIRASTAGSNPAGLVELNNVLYFYANNGINGNELWRSNGTDAGTTLIKDICIGSGSAIESQLTAFNGYIYFRATDCVNGARLWRSDGTTDGTVVFKEGITPSGNTYFVNGGLMYFTANNGVNGEELWKTDGTPEGTVMVKDINPGSESSNAWQFSALNGTTVLFQADDGTNGTELWKTDGTAEGTVMLKNISATAGSYPSLSEAAQLAGIVYFKANHDTYGYELFRTDGTEAGTYLVKDINPGEGMSIVTNLIPFDGRVYFAAQAPVSATELWSTDGTETGTILAEDIYPGYVSSYPMRFTVFNDMLHFFASDASNNYLYSYTPPEPTAPETPSNLHVNPYGEITARINWTAPFNNFSAITHYIVSYKTGSDDWTEINTGDADNFYELSGLVIDTTYSYRVKAVNAIGEGEFSAEGTFTTGTPGTLAAPTEFAVSGEAFDVTLTWEEPATTGGYTLTGYRIEYKTLEGNWSSPISSTVRSASEARSVVITVPDFETTYQFRVAAINYTNEQGPFTSELSYRSPDYIAPDKISEVYASVVGPTFATINWDTPNNHLSPITTYTLEYRAQGATNWTTVEIDADPEEEGEVSHMLEGLSTDTTYEVRISATNDGGTSEVSDIYTFTPRNLTAPRNLTIIAYDDGDNLYPLIPDINWTIPEFNGGFNIASYRIEYKLSTSTWDSPVGILTHYVDGGEEERNTSLELQYGRTYDFRITAINAADIQGPYTEVVQFTTPAATTYTIRNCSSSTDLENLGLQGINTLELNATYQLANDIDCTGETIIPITFNGDPFAGVFDGQNHTISNLQIEDINGDFDNEVGLFYQLTNAVVRNLSIVNDSETDFAPNALQAGSLAAYANGNTTVENVTINTASISVSNSVGGLISSYSDLGDGQLLISNTNIINSAFTSTGPTSAGGLVDFVSCSYQNFKKCVVIENTHVEADILGISSVGGLIGDYSDETTLGVSILNSSYEGNISASEGYIGGLIGRASYGSNTTSVDIINSTTSGNIDGESSIGGLVGYVRRSFGAYITIEESSSSMTVEGSSDLGGLIGTIDTHSANISTQLLKSSTIKKSYATGTIGEEETSEMVGGLVGMISGVDTSTYGSKVEITRSYFEGNILGYDSTGGLIGSIHIAAVEITDSYSQADIESFAPTGLLIGTLTTSSNTSIPAHRVIINRVYSSGAITTSANDNAGVGGMIGFLSGPMLIVANSFTTVTQVNENSEFTGGLIGYSDSTVFSLINNYVDQSRARTNICVKLDGNDVPCTNLVNADGEENDYFFGNNTVQPLNNWSFSSIWQTNAEDYPTLRTTALGSDRTKPVISLVGPAEYQVTTPEGFVDPGATATDNVDGNITSQIKTATDYRPNRFGTFTIYYDVCDAAGNCAETVTRTISVPQIIAPTDVQGYVNLPRTFSATIIDTETFDENSCSWAVSDGGESTAFTFSDEFALSTTITANRAGSFEIMLYCLSADEEEDLTFYIDFEVNLPGDLTGDQQINNSDLTLLLAALGDAATDEIADLNHDGKVDTLDFTLLLFWWGDYRDT